MRTAGLPDMLPQTEAQFFPDPLCAGIQLSQTDPAAHRRLCSVLLLHFLYKFFVACSRIHSAKSIAAAPFLRSTVFSRHPFLDLWTPFFLVCSSVFF